MLAAATVAAADMKRQRELSSKDQAIASLTVQVEEAEARASKASEQAVMEEQEGAKAKEVAATEAREAEKASKVHNWGGS